MKSTVWITQQRQGLDYEPAREFGEILFCLDGRVHPADTHEIFRIALQVAKEWNSEDILLPVSSTTSTVFVLALGILLFQRGVNSIKMLVHDAKTNQYRERKMHFNGNDQL